ncbi:uncharacterized protein LOC114516344 [Dendronephthya gigantea]|uniref:uncharacterized protein LOC114516344 n=1 Tax=Dendronephthya gigantea TaxID=151771 RepID=UPI001068DC53|nr:uncharacterized protein LOC114516344 [Dendronephthya gigantea]
MDDFRDFAVTMLGIGALQMPTLISAAPEESELSAFQILGFPFNLSRPFMRSHIAFSPGNILRGRIYTLITSMYYHTGPPHLIQNMTVLAASGKEVHDKVGRQHFLAIFTGGGIFGNLGMWIYYILQRNRLESRLLMMHECPILANDEFLKKFDGIEMETAFDILNSGMACFGASAGVNAILSFGACCSMKQVIETLKECWRNKELELDMYFFGHIMNIVFTLKLFFTDATAIIESFAPNYRFFEKLMEVGNITGHGGHMGGTMFGLFYYYMMYHRRR